MRTKHAGKVDANQADIVKALRKAGASVLSLSMLGHGVPDLLVGRQGGNPGMWLMEVKGPNGKPTKHQVKFIDAWPHPVHIVRTADEALRLVGALND